MAGVRSTALFGAPRRLGADAPLEVDDVACCLCGNDRGEPIAVGEDFEYRTSPDSFVAQRCDRCRLVYLSPRPRESELGRIYPPDYHAFQFSPERFGFVYRVRRRLEARRLLRACEGLPADARILDIGCGDGFHLDLLRDYGRKGWGLEGVDPSDFAVRRMRERGLTVHQGTAESLELAEGGYDLALLIATIEHVDDPARLLRAVRRLLKPGGRAIVVTDNVESLDFLLFQGRHWGGYHFPRHWTLFSPATLTALALKCDFDVGEVSTIVSPVNWVYSIRNTLVDWRAPRWLIDRFSLEAPLALAVFTLFDQLHQWMNAGALIRAELRRSP